MNAMRLSKYFTLLLLGLFFLFSGCSDETKEPEEPEVEKPVVPGEPVLPDNPSSGELLVPCDVQATEQTKKLYTFLRSVYGSKCLSATMANVNWNVVEAEHVYRLTGKYPAIHCFDFIHIQHSPTNWIDYTDITPVRKWSEAGGIVSLMWHFMVPTMQGVANYTYSPMETSFRGSNIFVENTWENNYFYQQLDKVCDTLLKLQAIGIAVLWRPLHEAAGNIPENGTAWFWWGADGADSYVRLWRLMFDYMHQKGVHNLIWIWTTQNNGDVSWFPGNNYVDIIGRDIYGKNATESYKEWKIIYNLYSQKMLALSECGNLLDGHKIVSKQATIGEQWSSKGARWLFFMPWYDYDYNLGTATENTMCSDDFWMNAMTRDYVLTREDVKQINQ